MRKQTRDNSLNTVRVRKPNHRRKVPPATLSVPPVNYSMLGRRPRGILPLGSGTPA